jgi:hypothetical protein
MSDPKLFQALEDSLARLDCGVYRVSPYIDSLRDPIQRLFGHPVRWLPLPCPRAVLTISYCVSLRRPGEHCRSGRPAHWDLLTVPVAYAIA